MKFLAALALCVALAQVASCTVFISEVLPHTDFPLVDFVEFYNDGATAVDLTNWGFSDRSSNLFKYKFPAGATIDAGGFKVLKTTDPAFAASGIALSSVGETVYLTKAGDTTASDIFPFPASRNSWAFIHYVGMDGRTTRPTAARRTDGTANSYPWTAELVITELLLTGSGSTSPFVKITATKTYQLFDPAYPTHMLQMVGLATACIPPNANTAACGGDWAASSILTAGSSIYFTSADPAAFRTQMSLDSSVVVKQITSWNVGSSGTIGIYMPDVPNLDGTVPYYPLDIIDFKSSAPFPEVSPGVSMVKTATVSYGNDGTKWRLSTTAAPTCQTASECPVMDSCTVASCPTPGSTCVYSLRACTGVKSKADADAYNVCFPAVLDGQTPCVYTAPTTTSPSTTSPATTSTPGPSNTGSSAASVAPAVALALAAAIAIVLA